MGVLDDAIREHLELRRRHGAAEDELERKEAEALGPARREVEAADGVAEQEDDQPTAEPGTPPEERDLAEVEPAADLDDAELDERFDPERLRQAATPDEDDRAATVHELPATDFPPPAALEDDPESSDVESSDSAPPLAEPDAMSPEEAEAEYGEDGAPPSRFAPAFGGEEDEPATIENDALEDEYGSLEEPAAAPPHDEDEFGPAEEGEDVLEETPDFLQETPEHDRLWFEQKPPRDFDLDDK